MGDNMSNLEQLEKTHAQFVFIHQRLTQASQYFVEEFEIAKDAITTITDMCKKMKADIEALREQNEKATEDSNV